MSTINRPTAWERTKNVLWVYLSAALAVGALAAFWAWVFEYPGLVGMFLGYVALVLVVAQHTGTAPYGGFEEDG